jgi:DNA-directed RNA polymerase subunit RPC12/RpoP
MIGHDPLACSHCHEWLAPEAVNTAGLAACAHCSHRALVRVFPAYHQAEVTGEVAPHRLDEQAGCFFHPDKLAERACDGCGRFLCSVCDIVIGSDHLCSKCIHDKVHARSAAKLENERVRHDRITLTIALVGPLLLLPLAPLVAPFVIYRAVRYWRVPASLVAQSRWRSAVALIVASLQLIGCVLFVALLLHRR